jgi:hypothetical protein
MTTKPKDSTQRALEREPVSESIRPSIAKRLRNHAKGKKDTMLTLDEFKTEVKRLQSTTLQRMLLEYEQAARQVLQAIEHTKQTGNDDNATLYTATSLIHQKSKSILRQLEKETDTPSSTRAKRPRYSRPTQQQSH